MLIGAYDPSAWAGLVFCNGPGRGFAFRFAVESDCKRFDSYDFTDIVDRIGPHAPDGSFARMSFDTSLRVTADSEACQDSSDNRSAAIVLEWSKVDNDSCVGRVLMNIPGVLEFRAYYPWDWTGVWSRTDDSTRVPDARQSVHGQTAIENEALDVILHRVSANEARITRPTCVHENGEYVLRYSMCAGDVLQFTAAMSTDTAAMNAAERGARSEHDIVSLLETAAARYDASRVTVDQHWSGLGASITNNLHWMTALKPEDGQRYTPAGRRWIFPRPGGGKDHWTMFCWDAFFNALELSLESPELASDTLTSVLATQYGNGNIPNWRGRFFGTLDRSQPPIGSFVTLKMFLRTGDREMLERAFPALEKWSAWWRAPKGIGLRRDGNGNGLFEWGCDLDLLAHSPAHWENEASPHQFAAWESGQDDLPNWDDANWMNEAETLDLESVDLNSLLALDFDCLSAIAAVLGQTKKADVYAALFRAISDRINEHMWDEDRGMYVDRFWNGRMSARMAASNFYPLIAGIAPTDRAERMLDTLLDETKFWGKYVLPTISRDDTAFEDQQYWRGTIWPPTNYLVYQGLKRYRFDRAAAALAERSVDLFLGSWRRFQVCRENYDSRTGQGGGQKYQSWGPLFALMGIEEFIDVTPWDGLRIGTLLPPPATTLNRIRVRNCLWKVGLSPVSTSVSIDGHQLLTTTGPIVLRQFELSEGGFRAQTTSAKAITVSVSLGTDRVNVFMDGDSSVMAANAVKIPAGEHSVGIFPERRV